MIIYSFDKSVYKLIRWMNTVGYVDITAMIALNLRVLYSPKAPFFRNRRGDKGKKG